MRKNRISVFLKGFALCLLTVTAGCSDNIPSIGDINRIEVSSISLSEKLYSGVIMVAGTTLDIALNVTVLPVDATERAESYYSSDIDVAIVSAKGVLQANSPGNTNITVAVGGKVVEFQVVVIEKVIIPATSVRFRTSAATLSVNKTMDASALITLAPEDANDGLTFTSSAPAVASVDADGVVKGLSIGTTTITAASKNNPNINSQLTLTIELFSGDYDRSTWSITASHPLFKTSGDAEKNFLTGPLDEDYTTNLCLVRPGKNFGSEPKVTVPLGDAIHFTVDMKEEQEVNYFRIRHRNTDQTFVRWYAFDEILGSNDGIDFTPIATNVTITDAGNGPNQVSPDIAIPNSTYRYIKFYAKSANCFFQSSFTSQGGSTQIQELYLGLSR